MFSLILLLAVSMQAPALTVSPHVALMATDQNVNLFNLDVVPAAWRLGLFDDDGLNASGSISSGAAYLALDLGGDRASFSPRTGAGGNQTVTNVHGDSLVLTGNDHFLLALDSGTGFSLPDSLSCQTASGLCTLGWRAGLTQFVLDTAPATVPLPAALPLLLSGLAGLGFGLRKRS